MFPHAHVRVQVPTIFCCDISCGESTITSDVFIAPMLDGSAEHRKQAIAKIDKVLKQVDGPVRLIFVLEIPPKQTHPKFSDVVSLGMIIDTINRSISPNAASYGVILCHDHVDFAAMDMNAQRTLLWMLSVPGADRPHVHTYRGQWPPVDEPSTLQFIASVPHMNDKCTHVECTHANKKKHACISSIQSGRVFRIHVDHWEPMLNLVQERLADETASFAAFLGESNDGGDIFWRPHQSSVCLVCRCYTTYTTYYVYTGANDGFLFVQAQEWELQDEAAV